MPRVPPRDYLIPLNLKCPECSSTDLIYDQATGDLICRNCGFVVMERITAESLYRQFSPPKQRKRELDLLNISRRSKKYKTVRELIRTLQKLIFHKLFDQRGFRRGKGSRTRALSVWYEPEELKVELESFFKELEEEYGDMPLDYGIEKEVLRRVDTRLVEMHFPSKLLDEIFAPWKYATKQPFIERKRAEEVSRWIEESVDKDFKLKSIVFIKEKVPPTVKSLVDFRKRAFKELVEKGLRARGKTVIEFKKRLRKFLRSEKGVLIEAYVEDPHMARFINELSEAYSEDNVKKLREKYWEANMGLLPLRYHSYGKYRRECKSLGFSPISKREFKRLHEFFERHRQIEKFGFLLP